MSLYNDFESFCRGLVLDSPDVATTCREIARKLNTHYYGVTNEKSEHLVVVGSVGRNTAISKTSDLDVIFELPTPVFTKYNGYTSNGQSALLQEIKNILQERYTKTDMRGDGQVVVIEFSAYTVELVPAFMQQDGRFKYPDARDGGSWKITDPIAEQKECASCDTLSLGNYYRFCRMLRKWKDNCGILLGGLLIDTLIYNHFVANDYYQDKTYSDYFDLLGAIFEHLKGLSKDQIYWLALGSNQFVYNKGKGAFIDKALKAYNLLANCDTTEEKYLALTEIFGADFPNTTTLQENSSSFTIANYRDTEEFIENYVPVDIRYYLRIDCKVTQNGFRDFLLSSCLRNKRFLQYNKSLNFFIAQTDTPSPYTVWWKVCNVGPEAKRRDCIRGQLIKSDKNTQSEHTDFYGPHFVECYLIKNGFCVARNRIDVPIGTA